MDKRSLDNLGAPLVTLDVSRPDPSLCKTFELHIDRVPSKLFLMESNNTVGAVVDGRMTLWSHESDKCVLCILFLKDGHPAMACVTLLTDVDIVEKFYKYKNGGWEQSRKRFARKIDALKSNTNALKEVILDLSSERETEDYKVHKSEENGVTTLLYIPNQNVHVIKVVDSSNITWEASKEAACFLAELYIKGNKRFLTLYKRECGLILFSRYEKVHNRWNGISSGEFCAKMAAFMGRTVSIYGETIYYTDWVRRLGLRL